MKFHIIFRLTLAAVAWSVSFSQLVADEVPAGDVLAPPAADKVRSRVLNWMKKSGGDDAALRQRMVEFWELGEQRLSPSELFHKTVSTFGALDTEAQELVDACRFENAPLLPPDAQLLNRAEQDPFF